MISNSQENLSNGLKPIGNFGKSVTTSFNHQQSSSPLSSSPVTINDQQSPVTFLNSPMLSPPTILTSSPLNNHATIKKTVSSVVSTNVNINPPIRQLSKSLPSTRNGKEDDFSNGGSLSAGELPRRPFRLQSIRVERKEGKLVNCCEIIPSY